MSDTNDFHMSKPGGTPARRVEVFTGAGRRRTWSAEDKAAIIAESYAGVETVSGAARRYGLTASQLFAWRRAARPKAEPGETAPSFVPAVIEPALAPVRQPKSVRSAKRYPKACGSVGIVELEIAGVTIRVGSGAQAETIAAVVRALRAGA